MDTPEVVEKKKLDKKIKDLLVVIAILLAFTLLPAPGAMTKAGMIVLGVFFSVVYSWVAKSGAWLTLLALFYFAMITGTNFGASLVASLGNMNVLILILALAFVGCMKDTGMAKFLTSKILALPFAKKGPYFLQATLFLAAFLTGALSQAVPAVLAILFAILHEATKKMGLPEHSKYAVMTGVGIASATGLGVVSVPYSYVIPMFRALIGSVGLVADFNILVLNLVMICGFVGGSALIMIFTKLIIRTKFDMEKFKEMEIGGTKVEFSKQVGWGFAAIGVLLIGMALPLLVSGSESVILQRIELIGPAGSFALAIILLCFAPDGKTKGKNIFDFTEKMRANTEWTIIWNIGVIIFIGNFMNNAEMTGIPTFIGTVFRPLTMVEPLLAIILLGVIANILTNLMSTTVLMMILGALAVPIAGGDPVLTAAAIVMIIAGTDGAIAMPNASFTAVFLHSQGHMFKPRDLVGFGYISATLVNIVQMAALVLLYRLLI